MSTAVFGAHGFKARSGRTVKLGEDGSLMFGRGDGYLSPATAFDGAEYFQAERDAQLGRWRDPLEPKFVVYRTDEGDVVKVLDEAACKTVHVHRVDVAAGDAWHAAARYFEAHSESKPWEDARNGELWLMKGAGHPDEVRAYLAVDHRFFEVPPKRPTDAGWKPGAFAADFTEGERFWPASPDEESQFVETMTPPRFSSQAGLATIRGSL